MLKRPRAAIGAALALGLAAYLYVPLPEPAIPAPTADDCVVLHLWSNGYHSDLGVPVEILPADHPLRRLYPNAQTLLIGWGERDFYYSDGHDLWKGLNAITPPSPSVMHVVEGAEAGSVYLGPTADRTFAVSREGGASLAAYLKDALTLDASGAAEIDANGKVVGHSYFLKAREGFHLFNVCNHWMARALRAAGLNINTRDKWFGGPLVEAASRAAPAACPVAASRPI